MAQDVGTVYVEVVPSGKGFGKSIEGDITQAAATGSKKSGSTILSKIGGAFSKAGKLGVGAIAAVGTGIVGLAAKGGFERALNIENAQAKLKGLGHDSASVSEIMNDALASVKGTAFGLGDAATVAASLSASGVKQGGDLTKVLKTVADTAQISGRSLTDIGTIFGSVAARGKLQGDDMLQLMSSGVPVLQLLGKHLGKTSADVSDMVSKGKVDFQTFADAMQEGLGGAALSAGTTFTGAWSNVKAALSRIGENLATPVLNGLRDLFNQAIPLLDNFSAAATPVMEQFGKSLQSGLQNAIPTAISLFKQLGTAFSYVKDNSNWIVPLVGSIAGLVLAGKGLGALSSNLAKVPKALSGITSAATGIQKFLILAPELGGFVAAFKNMASGMTLVKNAQMAWNAVTKAATAVQVAFSAALSANPIGAIVIAIAAVVAALTWFFTQTEVGRNAWSSFISWLQTAWSAMGSFFSGLWDGIVGVFSGAASAVTGAWNAVVGFFQGIWDAITGAFSAAINWIGSFIKTGWGQAILFFINPIAGIVNLVAQHFDQIKTIISNVLIVLAAVFVTTWNGIVSFITPIIQGIRTLITAVMTGIQTVWNNVWGALLAFFTPIINAIGSTISGVINGVQSVWSSVWGGIRSFFVSVWNAMAAVYSPIINSIGSTITSVVNTIAGVWRSVWGGISSFFSSMWNGIKSAASNGIGAVVNVVSSIGGKVRGAVSGAGQWLVSAGGQILKGLWNGISNTMNWLKEKIFGIGDSILSWAKNALGIHSPSRVFRDQVGVMIGRGMAVGIDRSAADVESSMAALSKTAMDSVGSFDDILSSDVTGDYAASLTIDGKSSDETLAQILMWLQNGGLGGEIANNAPRFPDNRSFGRLVRENV